MPIVVDVDVMLATIASLATSCGGNRTPDRPQDVSLLSGPLVRGRVVPVSEPQPTPQWRDSRRHPPPRARE